MALVLCQAQPLFCTAMVEKPGCCHVPGVILNPRHSPQNDWEDFSHESCGVKGRGINSRCILNMPDNNCYVKSPWKDEMMNTCTGGLGWFVLVDCLGIFWVGSFLASFGPKTTWLGFGELGYYSPHPPGTQPNF